MSNGLKPEYVTCAPFDITVGAGYTAYREFDFNVEWLETRICHLRAAFDLAVLNNRVVQRDFMLCRGNIISAIAFEVEVAEHSKFPIVVRIPDQCRFREPAFEPELIREKPDEAATRSDYRILKHPTAESNDREDLVLF